MDTYSLGVTFLNVLFRVCTGESLIKGKARADILETVTTLIGNGGQMEFERRVEVELLRRLNARKITLEEEDMQVVDKIVVLCGYMMIGEGNKRMTVEAVSRKWRSVNKS